MLLKDNTHFYKISKSEGGVFVQKKGGWKLDGDKLTLSFDGGGGHAFLITEMDGDNAMTVKDLAPNEGGLKQFRRGQKF